jgi:hypothetical protein
MRSPRHFLYPAVGVIAALVVGCSTWPRRVSENHRVSSENFVVELASGNRDASGGGGFFYRVMKKGASQDPLLVPSGFLDEPLSMRDHVRLIESTDGKQLLIEEDIPNDCWMHKNYLIVSADSGSPEHSFLDVPEAPHEGIPGPGGVPKAPDDPSTILSLDGGVLTFRYANGTVERRKLDRIRKMSKPHPMG